MMVGASFADNTALLFLGYAILSRFKKMEEATAEILIDFVHADIGQPFLLQKHFHLLALTFNDFFGLPIAT